MRTFLRWVVVLLLLCVVGAPTARAQDELSIRERVYGNVLAERLGGGAPQLARVTRPNGAGVRVTLPGAMAERLRFRDRTAAESFARAVSAGTPQGQLAHVEVRGDQVLVLRGPRLADRRVADLLRRSGWDVLPMPPGSPWVVRDVVSGTLVGRDTLAAPLTPERLLSPTGLRDAHGGSELIEHHLLGRPLRALSPSAQRDVVARAAAATSPKAMGAHQRRRVLPAYDALSSDAQGRFDRLLARHAAEPAVRDQLLKALAASSKIDEIEWLAGQLAGKDPAWIALNTRLTSGTDGPALRQQFSESCVPATAQVLRGEYDPVYALRTRQSNPDITAARDAAPLALNPALAKEQKDQLERNLGVAAARGNLVTGRGITPERAAVLLSEQAGATGLTYKPDKPWPTPGDPERAIALMKEHLRAGRAVPLALTNAQHQSGHVVMATAMREDAGGPSFLVFEPYYGQSKWISADQIRNQRIDIGPVDRIGLVMVPVAR